MVCSGHAGGNGLLHKPSWFHSDEGGRVPERGWKWKEEEEEVERKRQKKEQLLNSFTVDISLEFSAQQLKPVKVVSIIWAIIKTIT